MFWMIVIGLVMTSTVFTSCKKDDDEEISLVGTWVSYSTQWEKVNGSVVEEWTNENTGTITFNADGTYSDVSLSWNESSSGTYVLNGNKLTITCRGESSSLTIEKHSANEIVFKAETGSYVAGDNTYEVYSQLTLRKE